MTITMTVLIAPELDPYEVRVERCSVWARVGTHLRAVELDRRLADGWSPDRCVELSIRARRLSSARHRRRLARLWRRLPRTAALPPHPFDPTVPIARAEILRSTDLIEQLAELLESGRPLDPGGIAQAALLLCDERSPIYSPTQRDLRQALDHVLDVLEDGPMIASVDD
jgi:hypothetical protein